MTGYAPEIRRSSVDGGLLLIVLDLVIVLDLAVHHHSKLRIALLFPRVADSLVEPELLNQPGPFRKTYQHKAAEVGDIRHSGSLPVMEERTPARP
jgi:hypothetical protein